MVVILVVDDDPDLLTVMAAGLRAKGAEVFKAPSIDVAVQAASGVQFDMMILDWLMIGGRGDEVFRRITAVQPDLARKTILLTAFGHDPEVRQFARDNKLPLYDKPALIDELASIQNPTKGEQVR